MSTELPFNVCQAIGSSESFLLRIIRELQDGCLLQFAPDATPEDRLVFMAQIRSIRAEVYAATGWTEDAPWWPPEAAQLDAACCICGQKTIAPLGNGERGRATHAGCANCGYTCVEWESFVSPEWPKKHWPRPERTPEEAARIREARLTLLAETPAKK